MDRVPDAQLAVVVFAPALDPVPRHDRARVTATQGDGNGGSACMRARKVAAGFEARLLADRTERAGPSVPNA